jgi:hypothetical protein
MGTGRKRRNKTGFVDDEQSRWEAAGERENASTFLEGRSMAIFHSLSSRRASICIKLIGSPYWLLPLASKRDGIPVAKRERERGREGGKEGEREEAAEIERAPWRETRPERRSALFPPSHPTPFLGYVRGENSRRCAGSC